MVERPEDFESRPTESLVRIEPRHDDLQGRVAIIGELDLSNARHVEATLREMIRDGKPLTVDLIELSHLDSQGIAMIFRLAEQVRGQGGSLILVNPRRVVGRVLDVTEVSDVATIAFDEEL